MSSPFRPSVIGHRLSVRGIRANRGTATDDR
jgi:hypothetical protein